ncbi:MAG TPA: hypothetical protein VNG33_17310 [Polyangiaceae bacterium]|nr:hypothetical protein [Polyangiaceae bacterium]
MPTHLKRSTIIAFLGGTAVGCALTGLVAAQVIEHRRAAGTARLDTLRVSLARERGRNAELQLELQDRINGKSWVCDRFPCNQGDVIPAGRRTDDDFPEMPDRLAP